MTNQQLRIVILGILLCIVSVLAFARFVLVKKLISDDDLRLLFSNHREEIEALKSMCLEDRKKSDLTWFAVSARTSEAICADRVGSVERCREFARLFTTTKVGRVGWEENCVWLYVDGWGWAGKGKRKGLMWRATPLPPQDSGSHQRYVPIEDGWYIYVISFAWPLFSNSAVPD